MTEYHSCFVAQSRNESNNIVDHLNLIVGFYLKGLVAFPIASHVWCHRMVTSFCKGTELVTPGIPRFRKAVKH